jgi:putative transposase
LIIGELVVAAAKHSFSLPAYCAMPNHLHLLATASSRDANLLKFISYFKQKTAYRYRREHGQRLWQPRYFEYILRKAENFESVAVYIWNNPVRAEICARAIDYQFSGSTTIDWKKRYRYLGEWIPPWKGDAKAPG